MACKSRNPSNTFNFLRFRRITDGQISDLPVSDYCPIDIIFNPPTNLTAELIGIDQIELNWNDNSQDESGFEIERSLTSGSGFTQIATVGSGITSFTDSNLSPNTYYYRVRAVRPGEESSYSNEASEIVPIPFSFEIDTSLSGDTLSTEFQLPLLNGGVYNFTIDKGNGDAPFQINSFDQQETLLDYSQTGQGVYAIKIVGIIRGWSFSNTMNPRDPLKIISISEWGTLQPTGGSLLSGCSNLVSINATTALDLSFTDRLDAFFNDCTSLLTIQNISTWDTSGITRIATTFRNCPFNSESLNSWDVTNLTLLQQTFQNSGYNQPLDNWSVAPLENMDRTFNGVLCAFNQDITGWDVSRVTTFASCFANNTVFNQNVGLWSLNTNILQTIVMRDMFRSTGVFNQNLSNWDVTRVISMSGMFRGAVSFNSPISWGSKTQNVTNFGRMFLQALAFDQDVSQLDVTSGTEFIQMLQTSGSFSRANYDLLLNINTGWPSQSVQPMQVFGTDAQYTSANPDVVNGRASLIADDMWTISDGGPF